MRIKTPRRNKSCAVRGERSPARQSNEMCSTDFMPDQLYSGRRFQPLTLVDNFSCESLAIQAGQRQTGGDVVQILEQVTQQRGAHPETIRVDIGPEFI